MVSPCSTVKLPMCTEVDVSQETAVQGPQGIRHPKYLPSRAVVGTKGPHGSQALGIDPEGATDIISPALQPHLEHRAQLLMASSVCRPRLEPKDLFI